MNLFTYPKEEESQKNNYTLFCLFFTYLFYFSFLLLQETRENNLLDKRRDVDYLYNVCIFIYKQNLFIFE